MPHFIEDQSQLVILIVVKNIMKFIMIFFFKGNSVILDWLKEQEFKEKKFKEKNMGFLLVFICLVFSMW